MITVDPTVAAARLSMKPFAIMPVGKLAIRNLLDGKCGACGSPVDCVVSPEDEKEFYISGMCSTCQLECFGSGDE